MLLIIGIAFISLLLFKSDYLYALDVPEKQYAAIGDSVTLPCSASLDDSVDWIAATTGSKGIPFQICFNGYVQPQYQKRFTLATSGSGDRSLKMTDVQLNDTGNYTCIEEGGFGRNHFVALDVSKPTFLIAYVGNKVELQCPSAMEADVDWNFIDSQSAVESSVYMNGFVNQAYQKTVSLLKHNLFIKNLKTGDTGRYVCIEDSGHGDRHFVELSVLELASSSNPHPTTANEGGTLETAKPSLLWMALILVPVLPIFTVYFARRKYFAWRKCWQRLRRLPRRWKYARNRCDSDLETVLISGRAALKLHAEMVGALRTDKDQKGYALCITHSHGKIFIAHLKSNVIDIYADRHPFAKIKSFSERNWNIQAVAACDVSSWLYVADYNNNYCVWKVSTDQTSEFKKFVSLEYSTSWILSVSSGRLLILMETNLCIFDPTGKLATNFQLPRLATVDIRQVSHAVESISRGSILVLFSGMVGTVAEISSSGKHVMSYSGKGDLQLKFPQHFALGSEGRVFVADWGNNRVLVLSNELGPICEVMKFDNDKPRHICFIPESGRLEQILVLLMSGIINVYKIV